MADPKRKRWHLHFTPTSASWLNLIEGWFSVLTRDDHGYAAVSSNDRFVDIGSVDCVERPEGEVINAEQVDA